MEEKRKKKKKGGGGGSFFCVLFHGDDIVADFSRLSFLRFASFL